MQIPGVRGGMVMDETDMHKLKKLAQAISNIEQKLTYFSNHEDDIQS